MKKILGLDLGVASIGWAVVKEVAQKSEILGMGSRIIPLSTDDKDEFSSGNKISKNQKRTLKRTQRKGYDRYQLRRKCLTQELLSKEMFDKNLFELTPIELWGIRAKAVTDKVSLKELGRILYHLNQKRGYKSSRSDSNLDKKDTDYVAEVKSRHQLIHEQGITIGQKFYNEILQNQHCRIKQQVFPREAYVEEFDVICKEQKKHYPETLTNEFISMVRNEIIYYQRKLKSQKGLVSICEFEGFWTKTKEGKSIFAGPRVAPKSSPLFQVCKIWETVNHLSLKNKKGEDYPISIEKKHQIFEHLDNNEKLTQKELFEILGLHKNDGWYGNKQIGKGIQGNICKSELKKVISEKSPLLLFNLTVEEKPGETYLVDRKTGEVIDSSSKKEISKGSEKFCPALENEPLYQLWHTIYSIDDEEECQKVLINKFKLDGDIQKAKEVAKKLANIDFKKYGFGNKSFKAMRKILPYLMEGCNYSDSCELAGYNHSNSLTSEENSNRKLLDVIPNLAKNDLRQPIVEKILNQMINVVNAITLKYGRPDEIRIELARELKQSREERNDTFVNLNKIEKENQTIRARLQDEYGVRATRNNIIKWRLFNEINGKESKINATCVYCGKNFGISEALRGSNVDVEHIIPKSLLFDDSQSNKTLVHRNCNEEKGNRTAFDYLQSKGDKELQLFIERIDSLYSNKIIGKAKRDKLLMPANKIPLDFIERQMRETQYISRKAREILEQICYKVWSTSGSVTAYLRKVWGWNDVLMNLQLPKYREVNLTEWVDWETNDGQKHKKETIKDWSKRDDHRHHAIDALIIACTKQGFIQRLNTLSSQGNREEMKAEVNKQNKEFKEKLNLLDSYIVLQRPFTTNEVETKAAEILISYKVGKKVATIGSRKIKKGGKKEVVQTGIIVPRGPLSEESVYGKIKTIETRKTVKYLFENSELIFKAYIKQLVIERLSKYDNDPKKALASLKKEPIYLNYEKTKILEYGTCIKEEYVLKYPIETITAKDAEYIIDGKVKELVKERLSKFSNKEKEAFREPLFSDGSGKAQIRSVRMFTGLSAVEPVKRNENGKEIGFVKPGNNHHLAFYFDEIGTLVQHGSTFWHAIERKKYRLPVIIKNPKSIWDKILENKIDYPQSFLNRLPNEKWIFQRSLQQNEMFVLGLSDEDFSNAIQSNEKKIISNFLYKLRSIAYEPQIDLYFEHHLETQKNNNANAKISKRFTLIKSIGAFQKLNPKKIRLNNLGEVINFVDNNND